MTTTATPSTEQYDDLADLLDAHIDGDTHAVNAAGQVEKLNKHGNAVKTYANVGEFLDTLLRSNRDKIGSILNNYEDLTTPPTIPFLLTKNTANEAVQEIITNATTRDTLINAYNNYAAPAPLVTGSTISADRQNIEYSYNGVAQTPVSIIEFVEELYLTQKISIANLNMVVQKLDRAQKKREKDAERATRTGATTNAPGAPAGSPSSLQETHEDLNVPQIQAALNFAKINKKTGSAYSFDKKWFPVRFDKNASGVETYYACIQDERGNVTEINATNTSELIRKIMNDAKKSKESKDFAETIDMGTSFSRVKFAELCTNVSKSKKKQGEYTLNGKNYFVHENLNPATPPVPPIPFNPPQYTVSYPGAGETTTTGSTLHLSDTQRAEAPTVANLITFLEGHKGIYDSHHDLDREHLLGVIEGVKRTGKRTTGYVINGHRYYMWGKKGKLYAEVPNGEHGKEIVSAWKKEGLYDKIVEKVQGGHSAEKPAEGAAKAESTEPKDTAHAEDHGAAHPKTEGTFYDRSVEKIFGHGLIGRAFIGTKNMIPKPLRSLGGNTVGAGVTSGIVGGALYGGSLALGSVALSSAIVPAMTITFAASMTNRFLKWRKWWPHNKKEDGRLTRVTLK